MKKNFLEVVEEVKANVKQKSFSMADFEKLFAAFLNDREYTYKEVKMTRDGKTTEDRNPIKDFYAFVGKILEQAGMEGPEIEKQLDKLKFSAGQVGFFHGLMTEFMLQYMRTGRKFNLGNREDFSGSIALNEKKGAVKEIKGKEGAPSVFVKTDDHLVLTQSSGAPDWLRVKCDANGKAL